MSSGEYDLKKSEDKVGQLYPVLLSKEGKVIDGIHRLESDKGWRTETLEHIDDEEKLLVARCVSNWHRRAVPRSEKEEWINGLARIYQKQGYKLSSKGGRNEVKDKIVEVTGIAERTILTYLHSMYKQKEHLPPKQSTRVPASQRIKTELGREIVERHREEVKEEVREEIKAEVKAEVKKEAKEELRRDPDFLIEAAQTVDQVIPTLRPRPVTREGYHRPTLTEKQREEVKEAQKRTEEWRRDRIKDPWVQERRRWTRALEAMMGIASDVENVYCPVCGEPASEHLRFLCHPEKDMKEVLDDIEHKLNVDLVDEEAWKIKHGFKEV